jgi:hypothetical protein
VGVQSSGYTSRLNAAECSEIGQPDLEE